MSQSKLASRFENLFQRLLARESIDLYAEDLSSMFEVLATNLFSGTPNREGCYFDGVVGLTSMLRSPRKVEFGGEMWIGRDRKQWREQFQATATDERSTKQGIWIVLQIGDDRAETELFSAFGETKGSVQ